MFLFNKLFDTNNKLVECKICYNKHSINKLICCTKDKAHLICTNCIHTQVDELLKAKSVMITELSTNHKYVQNGQFICLCEVGCEGHYSNLRVLNLVGKNKYEKLLRKRNELLINLTCKVDYCPFCNEYYEIQTLVVGNNPMSKNIFQCYNPKCKLKSCKVCYRRVRSHAIDKHYDNNNECICPKCRIAYTKISGCNTMYCTQCRVYFCYICELIIDSSYNHSCPKGKKSPPSEHTIKINEARKTINKFENNKIHKEDDVVEELKKMRLSL